MCVDVAQLGDLLPAPVTVAPASPWQGQCRVNPRLLRSEVGQGGIRANVENHRSEFSNVLLLLPP